MILGLAFGIFLLISIRILEYFSLDSINHSDSTILGWPVILAWFFLLFNLIGKSFFLSLFNVCEGFLCETSLAYFMIVFTAIFFGFIVGLIFFAINRKYTLNKISKEKYFILLGFSIISCFIIISFISVLPYSMRSLIGIFPYSIIIYILIICVFTFYSYIATLSYDFMKKKKWWNLVGKCIYFIIFLVLFIIMWAYINVFLMLSMILPVSY